MPCRSEVALMLTYPDQTRANTYVSLLIFCLRIRSGFKGKTDQQNIWKDTFVKKLGLDLTGFLLVPTTIVLTIKMKKGWNYHLATVYAIAQFWYIPEGKNVELSPTTRLPVGFILTTFPCGFVGCQYQYCRSGYWIRCLFDPWILDPGSGIGFSVSQIPNPYFSELSDNFFG